MTIHQDPVFVTGSSGFVGQRIVKQLVDDGFKVRALARRAPQKSWGPSVEAVIGDLSKPETYASALSGASAVVHAALTEDLSHEPRATSELRELSARAGVQKFVHLSSIVVYGNPPDGDINEETAPIPSSDLYSRTKLAIEETLRSSPAGGQVIVLRLGCVYGPGGGWWTEGLLSQMRRGHLILVNGGTGFANIIHVADVAAIVSVVLKRSTAALEIFNVTDGVPVLWSRYFSELEKILGRGATVSMNAVSAKEYGRKWLRPSLARRVFRKLSGAQLVYPLDDHGIAGFASRAVYSNHKAVSMLGFNPIYDLETGMQTLVSPATSGEMPATTQCT
jgi:nucleoside-diphosphate-sugar epimerase